MTKKLTAILCSVLAIIACAAVITVTVLYLNRQSGISHLRAGGMDLTLTRESLYTRGMNEDGLLAERTDTDAADFTGASTQNIFGVTGNTVILPGCAFSAEMVVSGRSDRVEPFSYWLGIELSGELNELARRLKITVTVDGGEPKSCYLSEELLIGSESEPLAKVTDKTSSSFTVRVEFDRDISGSGDAQDEWAVFDLVVYAAKIVT